jgi:hypothetical protein
LPGADNVVPAPAAPPKRALLAPELEERDSRQRKTCKLVNGKPVFSPAAYPNRVTCAGLVLVVSTKINTITAKSTITTTSVICILLAKSPLTRMI